MAFCLYYTSRLLENYLSKYFLSFRKFCLLKYSMFTNRFVYIFFKYGSFRLQYLKKKMLKFIFGSYKALVLFWKKDWNLSLIIVSELTRVIAKCYFFIIESKYFWVFYSNIHKINQIELMFLKNYNDMNWIEKNSR